MCHVSRPTKGTWMIVAVGVEKINIALAKNA
jgi:hypothetical protein